MTNLKRLSKLLRQLADAIEPRPATNKTNFQTIEFTIRGTGPLVCSPLFRPEQVFVAGPDVLSHNKE